MRVSRRGLVLADVFLLALQLLIHASFEDVCQFVFPIMHKLPSRAMSPCRFGRPCAVQVERSIHELFHFGLVCAALDLLYKDVLDRRAVIEACFASRVSVLTKVEYDLRDSLRYEWMLTDLIRSVKG